MSDNYVGNVLSLLRLIRQHGPKDHARSLIEKWIGKGAQPQQVIRIAIYVMDQAAGATALIAASQLTEEAKKGLLHTTNGLAVAFSLDGMGNAVQSHIGSLDSAISQFAILSSAVGYLEKKPPAELAELIAEVTAMRETFASAEIDPLVKDTAQRHLAVLATLLQNVESLGIDAAMAAYFELVLRLRRSATAATPTTAEKVKKWWPEIERWAGRLAIIDEAINSGSSLLSHFKAMPTLLQYIP